MPDLAVSQQRQQAVQRPSVETIAAALRNGTVTSEHLVENIFARIGDHDSRLGAFAALFKDSALAAAHEADVATARGDDHGPLHGVPIAVKDIIATREGPTGAQSLVAAPGWPAERDATAVARLRKAGAVVIGKTTTMEYAAGLPDIERPFPLPRNPWDPRRWTGGSSSGTAGGVAAGLVPAGLGTDTGGSIRWPSAWCGVTGLKPTYGRVPRSGVLPLGYTADHVGPIGLSARDCALLLQSMAGPADDDPSTADREVRTLLPEKGRDLSGLRVGVVRAGHLPTTADPGLAPTYAEAISVFEKLGASTVEVELPLLSEMQVIDMVAVYAEAYSFHRNMLRTSWADYAPATRTMVALGGLIPAGDYLQAQRVRRVALRALASLFSTVDLVITPATAIPAVTYADLTTGGAEWLGYLFSHLFTSYWDSAGYPVMAVPMGFSADRLPLSLQIAGRPFAEDAVIGAGAAYQESTDWHLHLPPVAEEMDSLW